MRLVYYAQNGFTHAISSKYAGGRALPSHAKDEGRSLQIVLTA